MAFIGVTTYSTYTPYIRLVSGITSAVLEKKKRKRERERGEGERETENFEMRCINQESHFLRNDYQETMRRIQHLWEVVQRLSELFHKHEILSFFKKTVSHF